MYEKPVIPGGDVLSSLSTKASARLMRCNFNDTTQHRSMKSLDLPADSEADIAKAWTDPLSPKMRQLLKMNKYGMSHFIYKGQHLPLVSNDVYGTTTLWYIFLIVNGFTHPQEIPHGQPLYYPSARFADELIRVAEPSKAGTIVRT
mgnify:CR=1 FL=1